MNHLMLPFIFKENVDDIKREDLSESFYKPIYNLWLELEILKNKIWMKKL